MWVTGSVYLLAAGETVASDRKGCCQEQLIGGKVTEDKQPRFECSIQSLTAQSDLPA